MGYRSHPKQSPRPARVVKADRRKAWAIECRIAGMTLKQMAEEFAKREGCDKSLPESSISRILKTAVNELRANSERGAEQLRQIELERLDALIAGLWPAAQSGNAEAVKTLVGVLDRRYKLLGIEPPKRVEHDVRMLTWVQVMERANERVLARGEAPIAVLTEGEDAEEEEEEEEESAQDVECALPPRAESAPAPAQFDWSTDFDNTDTTAD